MLGIGPSEFLLWTARQVTHCNMDGTMLTISSGAIFIAANFCCWPVIGSACAQTWQQLLLCRLLLGIGMGVEGSTVPIFAAENSPAAIRGALVMSWRKYAQNITTCDSMLTHRYQSCGLHSEFVSEPARTLSSAGPA